MSLPPDDRTLRILILEDNPSDRELIERELRRGGLAFEAMAVETREGFLTALAEFDPDVMLVDYLLPGFDGLTALRLAQERTPDVPVIIVTGSISEEVAVECMKLGAADYLIKDRLKRLVSAVRAALEKRRQREAGRMAAVALEESEHRFRAVAESSPDGLVTADSQGRIVYWNRAATTTFGYAAEEVLGQPVTVLMPPRLRDAHASGLSRLLETVERRVVGRVVELSGRRKDGTEFPLEMALSKWTQGDAVFFSAIVRDITQRKEGEGSLRASEERLRILFESAPDGIYLTDLAGTFVDGNRAAERLVGYARDELIGKSFLQLNLLDMEGLRRAGAQLARHALGQSTGPDEHVLHRRDGTTISVEIRGFPVTIGEQRLVLGVARDLSERREAEALVQQFARRNELILNSAGEGILGIGLDGGITFANPAAAKILNRDLAETIGANVCSVLGDGGHTPERCPLLTAMHAGTGYRSDDMTVTRKGGERSTVRCVLSPTLEHGAPTGAVLLFEDVSERRRAEEALRQSEASYRSLFDNALYGIYRCSQDGRWFDANPALVKMLGYDAADELLGLDVRHDLYADTAQRDALVQRQHQDAEIRGAEVVWKRKDSTPITVRLSGRPHRDDGVLGFEMWAEDVTGERLLEAQLRQAQKMEAIGRLTGGIAHDFNNELSVILLNAQLAANTLEEGRAIQASDLHDIEDAAQRAASMTRKLLGFSRQADLVRVPTDLARVVGNLSNMLRRLLPEIIDLRIDADQPVPAVLADTGTIEQLLLNLVNNARDAMPDGGALRIGVETSENDEAYAAEHLGFRAGTFVTITVTDTGTGMDAGTKARIFEPFFTTKAPGVGTGLGLPMVYGLVKQHDGYVNVYSEPGLGTTFRLYFPTIPDDAVRQRTRASGIHIRGGTETILLVEDEPPLRRAGKRVLEAFGYTVLVASDGAEGLTTYLDHKDTVALVISDLVMPHMTGRQLYNALRQAGSTVKFILASGYTGFEAKERGSLDPAVPFIAKPWRLSEIGPFIRQVLDGDVPGAAPEPDGG